MDSNIKSCFKILEISPIATYEEAKAAYRDLVAVWHPDKQAHNDRLKEKSTNKLKEINAAWESLEEYFKTKEAEDKNTYPNSGMLEIKDLPPLKPVTSQPEPAIKKKSIIREYAESIAIAIILALIIRTFLVQAFKIPSGSMEDTLVIGDHLLVSKFIYGTKIPFSDKRFLTLRDPKRGDVIVFEYPEDPSKDFIKRIIGTPGDVVEGKDKKVYVNGKHYENPHEIHKEKEIIPREMNPRDNFGPITVPENSYFAMGDNRDRSYDSRFWKFVRRDQIKGLAFIKYWSWDREKFRPRLGSIGNIIN